jgi:plasmid maintenance system antidote protein VapI
MVSTAKTGKTGKTTVRAPRAKPAPPPRSPLVTALARQAQSFASSVLGNVGTATDMALSLAHSRIERPGPKAAVEKGAALLRDLRQAAGLTLDDLGRALNVADPTVLSLAEKGKVGLPFELILRLTAVLGRNDPVGFVLQMTRGYNPKMWKALEAVGVGHLLVQAGRERQFANIYRSHDAARSLSDADFATALAFADSAFATAVAFQTKHKKSRAKEDEAVATLHKAG